MRFDDRLETTLRQADDDGIGLPTKWQQLVYILAQNPSGFDPAAVASGLQKVRQFMDMVPATVREQCVRALSGRLRSAPLLLLLSGDIPAVAAAAVSGARLSDTEWADIVPHMSTRAHGFLRNRRDIGPMTMHALRSCYSADFALALNKSAAETAVRAPKVLQIRDIVDRIEILRVEREQHDPAEIPAGASIEHVVLSAEPIDEIRFETDEYGTISSVEGAPAGAVVGVDIAEPAFDAGPGPDAYGAAAFRQKMPLENARLRLCGAPAIAGDWRINAAPFFEPASGRFKGYRGILRRPNLAEVAHIPEGDMHDAENIEQLLHELRTPLGAIIGFSEIIEQQLFGPVTEEYRTIAGNILHDAQRLLSGFDDLSTAAKIETGTYVTQVGSTDCDWLSLRLTDRLRELSDALHVTLNLVHAHPVRPFALDNHLAERLFSRLLSAVIIGCEAGEILDGRFRTEPGLNAVNRFVLSLPKKLADMDESELFGSGPLDESHDAPLLGLGFSLRLVRSLARNVGGDLRFYNQALIVSLPAVSDGRTGLMDEER
ncbi:histidine kinase dimerization/phospho-acceptor domain-containing protein [Sphingorhabdus sp.]|uniref:histidine kinase dimerization/phospho-acceptor domain-containing protein n=1 Tax=Sphingorhabdus sp. TaxID=1902408 RepID=UPI0037852EE2